MSKTKVEHGRIISIETKTRGDALADDVAAGATSISVEDAGDFDEDGGWLLIGGQVVEFTECDDDTGVITLVDPLDAAAEQGDPVQVWSELYEEVVDYQLALVELDGEYDNPDPVVAEVAEGVGDLPEGDRGKAGESCTLLRVAEDEWEVMAVGGRSAKSRGARFEQDDAYALTAEDVTAGSATLTFTHRPNDEAVKVTLAGVPQRPTEWTIDYDAQTLTMPLDGWEQAGMVLWVHYAYRTGLSGAPITVLVPFGSPGWSYNQIASSSGTDYSAPSLDDSAWPVGQAPFGDNTTFVTGWDAETRLWLRRDFPAATSVTIHVKIEDNATVYVNGNLVGATGVVGVGGNIDPGVQFEVPAGYLDPAGNVLAIRCDDEYGESGGGGSADVTFADVQVTGRVS